MPALRHERGGRAAERAQHVQGGFDFGAPAPAPAPAPAGLMDMDWGAAANAAAGDAAAPGDGRQPRRWRPGSLSNLVVPASSLLLQSPQSDMVAPVGQRLSLAEGGGVFFTRARLFHS
jgi:hypothetical protein